MIPVEQILAAMISLTQYGGDVHVDPPEDRARLYMPTARAISAVAANRTEAAALISLGYHETAFARYVLQGFCEQGPVGAQCDGGRARGPWQVWAWCTKAWDGPDGTERAIYEGAKCAIVLLRRSRTDCARICQATGSGCKPMIAAFSGYAGRGCEWPRAAVRVQTMALIEGRLKTQPDEGRAAVRAVRRGHVMGRWMGW